MKIPHLLVRTTEQLVGRLNERRIPVEVLDRFLATILHDQPERFERMEVGSSARPAWRAPSHALAEREPTAWDLQTDAKWIDEPVLIRLELDRLPVPSELWLYTRAPSWSGESEHRLRGSGDWVSATPPLTSTFAPYQTHGWEASTRFWKEALSRLADRLPAT